MFKNYLKTAIRIMLRQKGYSFINVAGLSVGIAATLIIITYIVDEIGYDKFHADAARTYRIACSGRLQGTAMELATSPAPVAEAIQKEIPQIQETVRVGIWRTMPVGYQDKHFTEQNFLVADSNFFKFFSFEVVKGNPETFLRGKNKVVIAQSVAKKYFGNEDPIGKMVMRGAERTATEVTGVVKDAPVNSHIQFDMILSGESWDYMENNTLWTSNNLYTYFKVRDNADLPSVKEQLNKLAETNIGAEIEKYVGMSFKDFKAQGNDFGFFLQPMLDIHLYSNLSDEFVPNGNIQYLYIFGVVAAFIILVACINFMNLSTARSANRAKEVGVRKTIGAFRSRLIFQFVSESLLYSFISTILALGIIALSLNAFNFLSGKQLSFSIFTNPVVMLSLVLFTILIGLIAGSYPAFYLTAFKPTEVLKGKVRAGFKNSALRNVLVIFQFIISIALIFGSLVVYKQLRFMQEKNLGFDKENVLNLLHAFSLDKNAQAFKNEVASHPSFKGASFANNLPPRVSWTSAHRKGGSEQDYLLHIYQMDHDHLKTMGYEMAQGRFFSREFKSDTAAIILNEAAWQEMGYTNLDDAVVLSYNSDPPAPLKVIGVMKDINYQTLKDKVRPLAIRLGPEPNYEMGIRLAPGNTQEQIKTLEEIWKKYASDAPFEYSFLDENFDLMFRAEQRMSQIILVFTFLAISIACLGLFGLAAYTAEQRAKEISIRKVMGASIPQVFILLSKDFTILVMIAFALATPLAWFFANNWLNGFANRITIDASYVVIAGVVSFIIALLTISYQSVKAARENPVNSMRAE